MIISEKMFQIMKEKGITQAELARRTGISTKTISDWRQKKTNPGADKIMCISKALEITPEVLLLRVRHGIELIRLQSNLSAEVEKKTEENEKLLIHVVLSLATAIDAKDTYTNGHSSRVATYAKEIAARYGYSQKA